MLRHELPAEFRGVAFLSREGVAAGIQPGRLAASDLASPFHGTRVPAGAPLDTVLQRCAAALPRMAAHQFFSHTTAAEIWGMPLPAGAQHGDLHISAIGPHREPRTSGLVGHRVQMDFESLTMQSGFVVPQPAEVWTQLGSMLRIPGRTGRPVRQRSERAQERRTQNRLLRPDDLVVAADYLLTTGLATLAELEASVIRVRRRGAAHLRLALTDARIGSESPKETETRLLLVRAGLPEPELNVDLHAVVGGLIARLDLAYPAYRVAVEYDGRQHSDHEQFARDADRWAAIEAEGWLLVRVLSHHLAEPAQVVGRVRRALRSRGWTPPHP